MEKSRDRAGFRLSWIQVLRESSEQLFCPAHNSAFFSVGFILRQPPLHGGKVGLGSHPVMSQHPSKERTDHFPSGSGKSPGADSQQPGW